MLFLIWISANSFSAGAALPTTEIVLGGNNLPLTNISLLPIIRFLSSSTQDDSCLYWCWTLFLSVYVLDSYTIHYYLIHCFVDLFLMETDLCCQTAFGVQEILTKFPFYILFVPIFCRILPIHHLISFIVLMINFSLGLCNFFKSTKVFMFLKASSLYISLVKWHKTNLRSNATMINCKR